MMTPRISTNKNELNISLIHEFLSNSYWAKGRTVSEVKKTIKHSLCFGIYLDNKQIGFARVVSDYVIFAYLMDVFIIEEYRGKGYATLLIGHILNEHRLKEVKRWGLMTRDAHSLYKKFGFEMHNPQENVLFKVKKENE